MSRHMRALGFPTVEFDIRHGDHMDLRFLEVYQTLKGWISSGRVFALWCGTPCEGLTQARRAPPGSMMPNRLRDKDHIRGLSGLREPDRQALIRSNLLADRAGVLINMAYGLGLPGGEENPGSSWLWQFESRKRFLRKEHVSRSTIDYCSCGTPFRARTGICLWHCLPPKAFAAMKCSGRGVCTFTNKPHEQLSGAIAGEFATKRKNHYPDRLCRLVSKNFANAYFEAKAHRHWKRIGVTPTIQGKVGAPV